VLNDLRRLTKRVQFLHAARGARVGKPSFSLQMANTQMGGLPVSDNVISVEKPGIGFTVTKKTGNSPERNRIKRRLRAAVLTCAELFEPQHDYVLIGRRRALKTPFAELVSELEKALARIHSNRPSAQRT